MITLLLAVLMVAPAGEDLPGTAFAAAREETVLHAGPGGQHAGVLTLPQGAVVRVEDIDAAFDRVFVPEGFPVYVHGAYVRVDEVEQRVWLNGDNVNARVLPAVSGVRAVAQLSQGDGPLVLLDVEGAWVRVLAPASVPLYAPSDVFTPLDDGAGRAAWNRDASRREARRARRVAFYRATDPAWQARQDALQRVTALEASDPATLEGPALDTLGRRAAEVLEGLEDPQLRARAAAVQRAVEDTHTRRRAAQQAAEQLARQQADEMAAVAREARYLDFGLRFLGKGEARTVEGEVTRRTSDTEDVAVYSVQDRASGRRFKLSIAPEIGSLEPLLGKRVVLEGRELPIVNVVGPVLVIDKVVRVVR